MPDLVTGSPDVLAETPAGGDRRSPELHLRAVDGRSPLAERWTPRASERVRRSSYRRRTRESPRRHGGRCRGPFLSDLVSCRWTARTTRRSRCAPWTSVARATAIDQRSWSTSDRLRHCETDVTSTRRSMHRSRQTTGSANAEALCSRQGSNMRKRSSGSRGESDKEVGLVANRPVADPKSRWSVSRGCHEPAALTEDGDEGDLPAEHHCDLLGRGDHVVSA